MSNRFDVLVKMILNHEGGYVNDPVDPGGETNFGISKRAYPKIDIKALTKQEATAIYARDYWNRLGCDSIEDNLLCAHLFDFGVNAGVSRALSFAGRHATGESYALARVAYYKALNRPKYIKGWLARVNATTRFVQANF